ncbi:hypothetical protein [Herbidospora mongoliensis]|uniref:hypothetical protein n=1 Tax=Herbidospora mongoliensis TaxID=688067 RepID=UPI000836B30D|nr:hypothetical protein [Herbidospora mongoliensis]
MSITVTRSDTETRVEMSAKGVRDLDPIALRELTSHVAETIERGETTGETSGGITGETTGAA